MGYPNRLLNGAETVVVDVRPHWWYLAGPVFVVVLVIVGAVAAAVEPVPTPVVWVALVTLGLAVGWLIVRYVRWVTTRLVVTTTRVIDRHGVLSRRRREIPLAALTYIGYQQSLLERIIGAGDVLLESAGKDGQEVFPDLPHPVSIHNEIYRQMEQWRRLPSSGGPVPAESIPSQIEQLDQLRRRGLITDAEFEAKKTQLLGRL